MVTLPVRKEYFAEGNTFVREVKFTYNNEAQYFSADMLI